MLNRAVLKTRSDLHPDIPGIGDQVRTPRFGTVEIAAVFTEREDAADCGYSLTTEDYMNEAYRVYGKQYTDDEDLPPHQIRYAVVLLKKRG